MKPSILSAPVFNLWHLLLATAFLVSVAVVEKGIVLYISMFLFVAGSLLATASAIQYDS